MRSPDLLTRTEREARSLGALRELARWWDDLIRLPLLGRRIGLDAIVGLLPVVGDAAGALVAGAGLVVAARLGAPLSVLLRMLLNIGIDTLVGAVPVLGDLFDFGWRSQRRNVALLEQWLASPHRAVRHSQMVLAALAAGVVVIIGAAAWLMVRVMSWLWQAL
jgi:hypothetical protein